MSKGIAFGFKNKFGKIDESITVQKENWVK